MIFLKKDARSPAKKQVETHHVVVRWGAYCPFAGAGLNEEMSDGRVEINMLGGVASQHPESRNPENRLVFKIPDTNMQDEYSSRMAPGRISFNIKKGTHVYLRLLLIEKKRLQLILIYETKRQQKNR